VRASTRAAIDAARDTVHRSELSLITLLTASIVIALAVALLVAKNLVGHYHKVEAATAAARRATTARDEMFAMVTHELRTPLSALVLAVPMLEEDGPLATRAARTVANATAQMRFLVDDLVIVDALDADTMQLEKRACDARDVVGAAVDLFRDRAESRHVTLREDVEPMEIVADRDRLVQVLVNLVGNALKFVRSNDEVIVRGYRRDTTACFTVRDTGPGISPDHLPRLFDRYYQGERTSERGSRGLGLYICKRLVEAHGGRLEVQSDLGVGTTFTVLIPVR
jgi:signal transduction histidine kinase